MKTNIGKEECFAAIGSMTQAQMAQKALATAAIQSTVKKFEAPSSLRRGCIYGVKFSCIQKNNVEAVLSSARIAVKNWSAPV